VVGTKNHRRKLTSSWKKERKDAGMGFGLLKGHRTTCRRLGQEERAIQGGCDTSESAALTLLRFEGTGSGHGGLPLCGRVSEASRERSSKNAHDRTTKLLILIVRGPKLGDKKENGKEGRSQAWQKI